MNKFYNICILLLLLTACSPIKTPNTNQYKLAAYSCKQFARQPTKHSILITTPEAVAGYETEQMLYLKKPYELSAFVNNSWIDPPADMLLPLLAQSLQRSGYFYAVTSSPNSELTDYRLDTQLIELQQNFLKKPSEVDLVIKVVLSHVSDSRVIASRLICEHARTPLETPYGGVIAANLAAKNFTAEATAFVVSQIKRDSETNKTIVK